MCAVLTKTSIEPVQDLTRFIISFRGGGFLNRGGSSQEDCKTTTAFALDNTGRLSLSDDPDSVYSVDTGVASGPFVPSKPAKSIATKWAFEDGELTWQNDAFSGGEAAFCEATDGSITAYYTVDTPSDCAEVTFVAEDSKSLRQLTYEHN